MQLQTEEILCPFCKKGKIKCYYIPSFWQEKRSVTATFGGKRNLKRTREKYEVQVPCPNCGKSAKEIQKMLDEGITDTDKEKKILERLKKQGFSGEIKTKF